MRARLAILITTLAVVTAIPRAGAAQDVRGASPLRVGAAKVDVTPADSASSRRTTSACSTACTRARSCWRTAAARAALITVDAGGLSDADLAGGDAPGRNRAWDSGGERAVDGDAYAQLPADRRGPTTRRRSWRRCGCAKQKLAPARVGYGTGVSYINVNRQIIDPKTGQWWEGPNHEGPSDKTVAVLKFESLSGEPIAVYYNYAVHAVIAGQLDQVSGDIPGATLALHRGLVRRQRSSPCGRRGAAGDQNPIYFQQTYDLREIRIKDYAKRGVDISNAMPPGRGGPRPQQPRRGEADEPAAADGVVDGAVPRRGSAARDAEHRTDGDRRPLVRQLTRRSAARAASERIEGRAGFEGTYKDGGAGGDPARTAARRRRHDRRGERRSVQSDRAATEAGVAVQSDDDGDADERVGALRLHSGRCVVTASTRSRCCHRGCSRDARSRPSSTACWS